MKIVEQIKNNPFPFLIGGAAGYFVSKEMNNGEKADWRTVVISIVSGVVLQLLYESQAKKGGGTVGVIQNGGTPIQPDKTYGKNGNAQ